MKPAFASSSVSGATYREKICGSSPDAGSSQPCSISQPNAAPAPYSNAVAIDQGRTSLKLSMNHSAARNNSPGASAMSWCINAAP